MRLLIEECGVFSPEAPRGYRPGQHIVIEGNRILAISGQKPDGDFDRVITARNSLAIPGLVNAHTHSAENYLRGTTERMPLETWLVHLVCMPGDYSPRDHYLSIMLGVIEMLHSGVTAVVDNFWMSPMLSPEALDAAMMAYDESGMRAAVAPLLGDALFDADYGIEHGHQLEETRYVRTLRHHPDLAEIFDVLEGFFARWHGAGEGRLQCYVGPSGLQWCTEEFLERCSALARRHRSGFHMHLMETRLQDVVCRHRFGCTGVEWMAQHGLLGPEVSLPHCVWVTGKDLELIAGAQAKVVHNPAANLKLGSGRAPLRDMLDLGIVVALGSDGAASSDNQVLFDVIRLAALIHNAPEVASNKWISAREVFQMATEAGAAVLGLEGRLGRLEPGFLADITLLDLSSPNLVPVNDACRSMVFCETGASVRTVIVDGRVIMEDGHIEVFNEHAILAEAREVVEGRVFRNDIPAEVQAAIERFAAFRQDVMEEGQRGGSSWPRAM